MEEFRQEANENAKIYKWKIKKWHYKHIMNKSFEVGKKVLFLLFNSRLRLFPFKLKSRWSRPFEVTKIYSYGAMEIRKMILMEPLSQRLKSYIIGSFERHITTIDLNDPTWKECTNNPKWCIMTLHQIHKWRVFIFLSLFHFWFLNLCLFDLSIFFLSFTLRTIWILSVGEGIVEAFLGL